MKYDLFYCIEDIVPFVIDIKFKLKFCYFSPSKVEKDFIVIEYFF